MFIIIWQYTVHPHHLDSFIEYYHAGGKWVQFFQHSPSWIETELLNGEIQNQFITIDKWVSEQAYVQYLTEHKAEYDEIDKHCEGFTVEETLIGTYFMMEI